MVDKPTEVKSALARAIERLGTHNGHRLPDGADNRADSFLHDYFIARNGTSLLEARKKASWKAITDDSGILDDVDIDKVQPGSPEIMARGNIYALMLTVKNPVERIDTKKLRTELTKAGVSADVLDRCFAEATILNAPTKTWDVIAA